MYHMFYFQTFSQTYTDVIFAKVNVDENGVSSVWYAQFFKKIMLQSVLSLLV